MSGRASLPRHPGEEGGGLVSVCALLTRKGCKGNDRGFRRGLRRGGEGGRRGAFQGGLRGGGGRGGGEGGGFSGLQKGSFEDGFEGEGASPCFGTARIVKVQRKPL